ncbi:MAG: Ger(x)C family spore germination protein [Christensenellales bacterium]|jgi:spore germination protein KC
MRKRLLSCLLIVVLILALSGCWNYWGLDQLNIVVGISVDFDQDKNMFNVGYEVADLLGASKDKSAVGKLVYGQGKTLFEAARNTKRKEEDRLFFGCSNVLVINQHVAQEKGIMGIIEWFLRDGECRETMSIAISQEETAQEMLKRPEGMEGIVSITLHDILLEDKDVTGTTLPVQIYQVYNILHSPRKAVVVPALHKVQVDEDWVAENNGMAVIKEGRLVGFLPPEQSRYVLFMENELGGGILTLSMMDDSADDISLEIFRNQTKKSYTYEQGKFVVKIETITHVSVGENHSDLDMMDKQVIKQIEDRAAEKIKEDIENVVGILQHELNADIFGFGEMIYEKEVDLWRQISPMWDQIYPTLEVQVCSEVNVMNAAFTK